MHFFYCTDKQCRIFHISGSGFGTLTFGPLLQFLLKKCGLTTTLRILSAIMSLLALASLTFKRFSSPLEQMFNMKRTPAPFSDMKIWKNKAFVLYAAAVSLFMLGYFIPYVHVVRICLFTISDSHIGELWCSIWKRIQFFSFKTSSDMRKTLQPMF